MNRKLLATAALLGALPAPAAFAQDAPSDQRGAYVSFHAGIANVNDVDIDYFDEGGTFGGTGAQDSAEFSVDLKSAFNIAGAIGYDFGIVRADIELAYSRNEVKSLTLEGINGSPATLSSADRAEVCDYLETDGCGGSGNSFEFDGGKLRQLSALANLWADIPTGSVVIPYVGGGIGVGGYELDGEGKARFAWQIGAGASVAVSPSVALTLDYRHRQIGGGTIEDDEFEGAGVRIGKVRSNIFTAGLRFVF